MADADKQKEPSIEDILSSIRQAVSSEEEGEQSRGKDSTGSGELNDDAGAGLTKLSGRLKRWLPRAPRR